MAQRVTVTKEGMMLDQLVLAAAGSDAGGRVEEALAMNPGLADELAQAGHRLDPGRSLTLPTASTAPAMIRTVKLWD
jgi:phage tail protein X